MRDVLFLQEAKPKSSGDSSSPFPSNGVSGLSPSHLTSGDSSSPFPLIPPDPPDPDFPPLSSASPKSTRASSQTARPTWPAVKSSTPKTVAGPNSFSPAPVLTGSSKPTDPRSGISFPVNFKILQPKHSSPIQTNKASSPSSNLPHQTTASLSKPLSAATSNFTLNSEKNPFATVNPNPVSASADPPPATDRKSTTTLPTVNPPTKKAPPTTAEPTQDNPPNQPTASSSPLLEKIRKQEDKSLKRLAPVTLSEKGVPRVLIPDSVFQIGAEIHKDFIICYFNGKTPPYTQIQSVLSHMWGKGKRVEIHMNPLSRSMLVRIPSDYLRQKILEKSAWYVGDSMFQAVQWSSSASTSPPNLESIQIWAHLTGVPLDLRHQQGLSLVAGLVGEPKETDDFTKNLVSLTLSHVKVAVNLTKPLPSVVEFVRQSGEVVEVQVTYPWVPPTCTYCKELGHVSRNCPQAPPAPKSSETPAKKAQNAPSASQKGKNVAAPSVAPTVAHSTSNLPPHSASGSTHASASTSSSSFFQPEVNLPPKPATFATSFQTPRKNFPPSPALAHVPKPLTSPLTSIIPSTPPSPPDTFLTPSLKRPRPDPDQKPFPSFTAQLSYFSTISSSNSLPLALPAPSFVNHSSNPFTVLDPDGSLPHEETID
ncbi:hypothetical protein IGI04_008518 [Brassica rapa subsp. trilocularis]|uniref:CCHC-type domain-containing protein n=1 Tax=Brassica rapa subsp. trilocularis TaxID=1813537 RepID=A0ABQ7NR52_BRACM|nr:hypothetical protein IGI04_008518 [Brassica rapa subsp. trilocularis]